MFDKEYLERIAAERKKWEEGPLASALKRFGVKESPNRFCTPLDIAGHNFLQKVGFPGQYPFTASEYAFPGPAEARGSLMSPRAGIYSGYGTAEDTRDLWRSQRRRGANVAFDLPTQIGYDSDHPMARGEVGKLGVAVDTLRDMEILYEAFQGVTTLDRMSSNFTINAPAVVILAMYLVLADEQGVPYDKLIATPQNDILKEFVARGTYIFPPRPSMRLTRDTIAFCTKHAPRINTVSINGSHMREAGATAAQELALAFSHAIAYGNLGLEAGLKPEEFLPRFTIRFTSGSMEFFREIARARAARRMWARLVKERFHTDNPRCMLMRDASNIGVGRYTLTTQRLLNNLTRGVIGGVLNALSGGDGFPGFPYDEPLGLGHSLEGWQLSIDAARIIRHEAKLCDVIDPLAGSYYVESLTDEVEAEAQKILDTIDDIGGAVAAIESGYTQREIAKSAYEFQRKVETGEVVIVGVNRFTGESELEVTTTRLVDHPYDPARREAAEAKQLAKLAEIKRVRDSRQVKRCLKEVRRVARTDDNIMPATIEAVKAYATVGEVCDVLREVFGEYEPAAY